MLWLITSNCCIYFFTSVTALKCAMENSIVREVAIENCSPTVTECFRFSCNNSGRETKDKGCNDNSSTLWNCQALGEACMEAGGTAYCDTCVGNLCNNATATSFASVITTAIFSILLALNVAI